MRNHHIRWLAAAVVSLTASSGVMILAGTSAGAATACKVDYTKSDWGAGFTSNITVTNLGDAWTSWTLKYSYAGNQTLTNGWSAKWSQSGKDVTVANEAWNGSVATNATVTRYSTRRLIRFGRKLTASWGQKRARSYKIFCGIKLWKN